MAEQPLPAVKPEDLSSAPEIHTAEGKELIPAGGPLTSNKHMDKESINK